MRILPAFAIAALAASAFTAAAQERPNTILVMDGSGSMWGQIDGIAKITIAQEVVGGLLADFPADQGLGLTVYGHRERGECTDIETVVAPAPGTADQIVAAVDGIKPLGKTPMTDAVIAAAQALRYTEDKATVILVSDGVETCNPDPCAAARLLEEAGIDFTAHVIGFDVGSDAAALAQMQCIADETGGQFLTADTADQLTDALTQVAVVEPEPEPEPEPVMVPVSFSAVIEDTPDLVEGPVLWSIEGADGLVAEDAAGNPFALDLVEGSYVATAYSATLEMSLSRQFIAIGAGTGVEIAFPEPAETARILAPAEAVAGSSIEVGWDGPARERDFIGIGEDSADGAPGWDNFTYVAEGNPLTLLVPPQPGPHVIQYFKDENYEAIGAAEIMVTPVEVTLTAAPEIVAGSTISVEWTGPDYVRDFIGIVPVVETGTARWQTFAYTSAGNPLEIKVPVETGAFEITYFMDQDYTPVHSIPLTITQATARIVSPSEAVAGSTIEVGWTGPDYEGDFIGIGEVGATGAAQWENNVATQTGNPIRLAVPPTPGDYVIQYFVGQGNVPIAEAALTASEVTTSVSAPAEAVAGSTIDVEWTGPDYDGDYIGIGEVDATGGSRWANWVATEEGSPVRLQVPAEPGEYVITYFARQDRTPLAQTTLTATAAVTSVSAPAEAVAGSTIDVEWTGPDYDGDYIGIGEVDATGGSRWANWVATEEGSPVRLQVPAEPGEYVITYFARQDRTPLAQTTLKATAAVTSVSAPAEAVAGSTIEVEWTGPDYDGDYIGIGEVDATGGSRWANWVATEEGSPAKLLVPPLPGEYRITYFARQDRTPLAETTLTVVAPEARVTAPSQAVAGSTIEIAWTGPAYSGDYIGIGPVDATGGERWTNWVDTEEGSPTDLLVPTQPGDYLITYYARQNRTPLFELLIAVTEVDARLIAPASAAAGSVIDIGWEGPGYSGDYIGIGKTGESGGRQWSKWADTEDGNPLRITVPDEPGAYVIQYFLRQDRRSIAQVPLTIE